MSSASAFVFVFVSAEDRAGDKKVEVEVEVGVEVGVGVGVGIGVGVEVDAMKSSPFSLSGGESKGWGEEGEEGEGHIREKEGSTSSSSNVPFTRPTSPSSRICPSSTPSPTVCAEERGLEGLATEAMVGLAIGDARPTNLMPLLIPFTRREEMVLFFFFLPYRGV